MKLEGYPQINVNYTAYMHEINAAILLRKFFGDDKITVGDRPVVNNSIANNYIGNEPDIFTNEVYRDRTGKKYRKMGIEVTACESKFTYEKLSFSEYQMASSILNINDDIIILDKFKEKLKKSIKHYRKNFKAWRPNEEIKKEMRQNYYNMLGGALNKKMSKLSSGRYTCCKNIMLAMTSFGTDSDLIEPEQLLKVYKEKLKNFIESNKEARKRFFNDIVVIFKDCAFSLLNEEFLEFDKARKMIIPNVNFEHCLCS